MPPTPSDPDSINAALHALPFVGLITGKAAGSPLITRLLEAAIIGGVLLFGVVESVGTDIEWLKARVQVIESQQNVMMRELYSQGVDRP